MKYTKDGEALAKEIEDIFHYSRQENTVYYLYAIYQKKQNNGDYNILQHIFDNSGFDKKELSDQRIENLASKYNKNDIACACELLFARFSQMGKQSGIGITPDCISKLAKKILSIQSGETVVDFGSCMGDFLLSVTDDCLHAIGIEINTEMCTLSQMRAEMLGKKIEFINEDIFKTSLPEYDKLFINAPYGMRAKSLFQTKSIGGIEFSSITSSDWLFALKGLEYLKEGGKVLSVVTLGSLFNKPDSLVRKQLVEKGLIEAIILLPEKLFGYTNIKTALVLISKGNKRFKAIDASDCFVKMRRTNTISDDNIEQIIEYLKSESENSKTLTIDSVDNESFILDPKKFLSTEHFAENEQVLGDFVQIRRAGRLSANELDHYVTDRKTSYKCLTIANAQDWLIGGDFESFKEMPPKSEKFVVKAHSIILSRSGSPEFKASLFEGVPEKTVIANGNFYIIEVDEEKLNPYYLLAYLNSSLAQKRLTATATGAVIKMLPTEAVKALRIPIENLEIQLKIGNEVKTKLDEINKLKGQANKLNNEILALFN